MVYEIKNLDYALEKYGDNSWWMSHDPKILLDFQSREKKEIIPMSVYKELVEELFQKKFDGLDFAMCYGRFKEEIPFAISKLNQGIIQNDPFAVNCLRRLEDILQKKV